MESPHSVQIVFDDGSSENLLLTAVGPDTYRAEESSMLSLLIDGVGAVRYKDLIQLRTQSDGSLRFVKIVTPSGLKTNSWILPKDTIESQGFRPILDSVMELGGNWEQVFGGVLLVHLPPEVADSVEARINHFRQNPGRQL